jgi:hypothetical protein
MLASARRRGRSCGVRISVDVGEGEAAEEVEMGMISLPLVEFEWDLCGGG